MPRLKTSSPIMKIFRPDGTPYASAEGLTISAAVTKARKKFKNEFGRWPEGLAGRTAIVEVTRRASSIRSQWHACVLELEVNPDETIVQ